MSMEIGIQNFPNFGIQRRPGTRGGHVGSTSVVFAFAAAVFVQKSLFRQRWLLFRPLYDYAPDS
jgi:hypothetical protein